MGTSAGEAGQHQHITGTFHRGSLKATYRIKYGQCDWICPSNVTYPRVGWHARLRLDSPSLNTSKIPLHGINPKSTWHHTQTPQLTTMSTVFPLLLALRCP